MKKEINKIKSMIKYIEIYLPEKWTEEKWFIEGREAIKNISKIVNSKVKK